MPEQKEQSQLLKFLKIHPEAQLPSRSTKAAAGLDLYSVEGLIIPERKYLPVKTGISVEVPVDCYGRIAPRSGLALKYGIDVLAGVIDSDYRGEIICLLINHSNNDVKIKKGTRIAQLIIESILTPQPIWAEELEVTLRGDKGFGSSGLC